MRVHAIEKRIAVDPVNVGAELGSQAHGMMPRGDFEVWRVGGAGDVDVPQLSAEVPDRRQRSTNAAIDAEIGIFEFVVSGDWRLPGIALLPNAKFSGRGDFTRRLWIVHLHSIRQRAAPSHVANGCLVNVEA